MPPHLVGRTVSGQGLRAPNVEMPFGREFDSLRNACTACTPVRGGGGGSRQLAKECRHPKSLGVRTHRAERATAALHGIRVYRPRTSTVNSRWPHRWRKTRASQLVPDGRAEPPERLVRARVGHRRAVTAQHRAVVPAHQPHHGIVVHPGQPQVVRGRVTELVHVD
jgi:hypothetical protein